MRILNQNSGTDPSSVLYRRCTVDLATGIATMEEIPCHNLEDVLGGVGRSFQMLAERTITEAYCPENPLIMNTGILTGSNVMTGLRTYFSAYSPLKQSSSGLPGAMWSAASGKFGNKLKWCGVDEVVFENCSTDPVYIVFREGESWPHVEIKPASHLLGLSSHEKMMALQKNYPDAHFAAIGPAGENYKTVFMGAIAMSTENQLKSGEDKCRFAGRGGMGSLMGYKNLISIVVQSKDKLEPVTSGMRDINHDVIKVGGSIKFQPISRGGSGGTWVNYDVLQTFHAVAENNFRPKKENAVEGLFRENVEKSFDIRSEGCFRCGIRCHNNIHRRNPDGSRGKFLAKFDYEPLNLFGSNLGLYDAGHAGELIQLCDNLSMDAISLGTTISYVLDYNERFPEKQLLNGAVFGDFERIKELVIQTGMGNLGSIGKGVKRLSEQLGETAYAIHVKGLELPAYLPETNPGYVFAIAGGHMSMGTHLNLVKGGGTSIDYWVKAVTTDGLLRVGFDMIGLCKFVGYGLESELVHQAIKLTTGLDISPEELLAAVRRTYLRGLSLELRQGFSDEDFTLPSQVFDCPNPNILLPHFITREFLAEFKAKVWAIFEPEMEELWPERDG